MHTRPERRIALPADFGHAVFDIAADLVGLHRVEMMRRDHALAQLFQPLGVQRGAKFGLTQQQNLQQRMRAELKIRQHAQFFQRRGLQVLGFIDDEKAATSGARLILQEILECAQRGGLVGGARVRQLNAECLRCQPHQFVPIELAGHDLAHGQPLPIDRGDQMRGQRRFARAHFAGDDNKTLALRQAIAQIRQRLAVSQAFEIEIGIGRELERPAAEPIKLIVHRRVFLTGSCTAARAAPSFRADPPKLAV